MKLYTTKMLTGDQNITARDYNRRPVQLGNVVNKWSQANHEIDILDIPFVVTHIFKNGNITLRELITNETREGKIFYLGTAERLRSTEVLYLKES